MLFYITQKFYEVFFENIVKIREIRMKIEKTWSVLTIVCQKWMSVQIHLGMGTFHLVWRQFVS